MVGRAEDGTDVGVLDARGPCRGGRPAGQAARLGPRDRWDPETETITWTESERRRKEKRFRSQGVRFDKGKWIAHPDADDSPVPAARTTFLSPFDQLIHDRSRAQA